MCEVMEMRDGAQWGQGLTREVLSLARAEAVVLGLPTWFGNVTQILDHFMFLTP